MFLIFLCLLSAVVRCGLGKSLKAGFSTQVRIWVGNANLGLLSFQTPPSLLAWFQSFGLFFTWWWCQWHPPRRGPLPWPNYKETSQYWVCADVFTYLNQDDKNSSNIRQPPCLRVWLLPHSIRYICSVRPAVPTTRRTPSLALLHWFATTWAVFKTYTCHLQKWQRAGDGCLAFCRSKTPVKIPQVRSKQFIGVSCKLKIPLATEWGKCPFKLNLLSDWCGDFLIRQLLWGMRVAPKSFSYYPLVLLVWRPLIR